MWHVELVKPLRGDCLPDSHLIETDREIESETQPFQKLPADHPVGKKLTHKPRSLRQITFDLVLLASKKNIVDNSKVLCTRLLYRS